MNLSRREFLKKSSFSVLLLPILGKSSGAKAAGEPVHHGVLVDTRRCVDCKACQIACKEWWGNKPEPYTWKTDFDANTFTYISNYEIGQYPNGFLLNVKKQCMHCEDPACVAVCPTGAMYKDEKGRVLWDSAKCIGCRYCIEACPYGVPVFDMDTKEITKCWFCYDRIDAGLEPACVSTCPTNALQFGTLPEIKTKALKLKEEGYPVFGLNELGGTSWIYVFPKEVSPQELGFPKRKSIFLIQVRSYIKEIGLALSGITVLGVLGHLVFWHSKSKEKGKHEKAEEVVEQ